MLPGWPLLLLLQTAPAPVPDITPFLGKAQASVLLVHGKLGGVRVLQGSGVVIAPCLVATNAHVVEGALGITVGRGQTTWTVTEVRVDRSRDLCLLTVPGLMAPPAELAPEPTEPGQKVMAVGYPGGRGPVATAGRLRGIWHHGEGCLLQSDALTMPGNSGGGLFDEEGRLLGLTTLTFTPSPRLNFSVPVTWIQELALQPPGEVGARPEWGFENHGAEWLERLAADPRNWPAWESAAQQWVRDLPKDENAWLALGLALDRSARVSAERAPGVSSTLLQEGVEAYRRSLSLREHPKTWNNLGVALDLLNHFDEAEVAFGEALRMNPAYALAWLNLGSARMNARRYNEAVPALQKGVALRPDDGEAWGRLAHCQRRSGERGAAVESFRIALRYRPMLAELWLDLGQLLVELSRREEAQQVQARLEALNPALAARLQAALDRVKSDRSPEAAGARRREP
jgi:tetratricopeptide (TPR) repeat protein